MRRAFVATVVVFAAAIHLIGASLAGVTLPDATEVAGKNLVLNGIGLRSKMMFKVYVAGLYLEAKSSDGAAILKADAPKRVTMQFMRDLDKEQMVEAFIEAFNANSANAASLKADFDKMLAGFDAIKTEPLQGPSPVEVISGVGDELPRLGVGFHAVRKEMAMDESSASFETS